MLRVAICADFPEEGWPSMDRVAGMLLEHLRRQHAQTIEPTPVCPQFARRAMRLPGVGASGGAFTVDRAVNRWWDYPRRARAIAGDYDVFHVVDHSYAQLVDRLPAGRTVVTCHDLDTFRSVLYPGQERRSAIFRMMTRRILAGLRHAACVTCDTASIRDELIALKLVAAERLLVAPVGVSADFSPQPDVAADRHAARMVGSAPDAIEILHVGSTISRKRIDVLLRVCGALVREIPQLQLVRVGGPFTAEQHRLAQDVGLDGRISVVGFLDERTLAAVYRRAALVLQPSEREGFGFPLVEAMACGTPVVASDIAVLKEVGGAAVEYCPVGDESTWQRVVAALLRERREDRERWTLRREAGRAWAGRFSWQQFAARLADVYQQIASTPELSVSVGADLGRPEDGRFRTDRASA